MAEYDMEEIYIEIEEIKIFIDDYIDDWELGKKIKDENETITINKKKKKKNKKDKRISIEKTRKIKRDLYKIFKNENLELYTYLKDNIKEYEKDGIKYDIILLFMTKKFILLLQTLNNLQTFIDLIKLLSTKQLMTTVERGNLGEHKNEIELFEKYKCLNLNIDTEKQGIKCPCNQHHIMNLFVFGDVQNNKMLIIGSDCIWRIESIIYLLNDEKIKNDFLKQIRKQRIELNKKIKEDNKKQKIKRLKEQNKEFFKRCDIYLNNNTDKKLCKNIHIENYKLSFCENSKKTENDIKKIKKSKNIIINDITINKTYTYCYKCNLERNK